MKTPKRRRPRASFTLVELMIVVAIIAIIAGMSTAALMGAAEEGRKARAEAQIVRIDQLISEKWNSYRYRQLSVRISGNVPPVVAAQARLNAIRELMRMEMPDRMSDINDGPAPYHAVNNPYPIPLPSLTRGYIRKSPLPAAQNAAYQQAECLYLIIAEMRDGDKSAINFFMNSEIGDADGDGMYEILDPWGTPIMFLRWAPGYSKFTMGDPELAGKIAAPAPLPTVAVDTFQLPDGSVAPDEFDPLKADYRWNNGMSSGFLPFKLRPLIFSAGPDRVYDIYTDDAASYIRYALMSPPSDPFAVIVQAGGNVWIGSPADYDGDGDQNGDNITNHGIKLKGE